MLNRIGRSLSWLTQAFSLIDQPPPDHLWNDSVSPVVDVMQSGIPFALVRKFTTTVVAAGVTTTTALIAAGDFSTQYLIIGGLVSPNIAADSLLMIDALDPQSAALTLRLGTLPVIFDVTAGVEGSPRAARGLMDFGAFQRWIPPGYGLRHAVFLGAGSASLQVDLQVWGIPAGFDIVPRGG